MYWMDIVTDGEAPMKRVTILALNNPMASSVLGTMDIFCQVGLTWNHIFGLKPEPFFEVEIVTRDGNPVSCLNNATIHPNRAISDVESTDVVIVSSFYDMETLSSNEESIRWLRERHERGATLASVCLGTFFLAETGLLDGKTATTHWGFADVFREMHPQIRLRPDQLIVDEGTVLSSGGCNSYIDLSAYLIERYCGREMAVKCSKTMIHDFGRSSQAPYTVFQALKGHNDDKVLSIQQMLEDNHPDSFDLDALARAHGMSRRTLERRFKTATGDTPLLYLQRVRVEAARQMLEGSGRTFDEIAYNVGYEDSGFFRKLFVKHTGLRPGEYKTKFRGSPTPG